MLWAPEKIEKLFATVNTCCSNKFAVEKGSEPKLISPLPSLIFTWGNGSPNGPLSSTTVVYPKIRLFAKLDPLLVFHSNVVEFVVVGKNTPLFK